MVAAVGGRSSQLLRGVLDVCLLALIAEEERYGYELIKQLEARGLAIVGEGSIYPLLSRLQRAGLIEGSSVPSNGGPPRKYYRITPEGRRALDTWVAEWESFSNGVERVIGGGS